MADALEIDGDFAYVQWAWNPPENMKLPEPSDWDEDEEFLQKQCQRWEADQDRQKQELLRNLEMLERLEGKLNKCKEDPPATGSCHNKTLNHDTFRNKLM